MVREAKAHKKPRWYHAIIVDQHTNLCHEGLARLLAIVRAGQGQMCWIARADDFHFAESTLARTARGYDVVTRKMDTVQASPLNMPFKIIDSNELPERLR